MAKKKSKKKDEKKKDSKKKILKLKLRKKKDAKKKDAKKKDAKKKDAKKKDAKKKPKAKNMLPPVIKNVDHSSNYNVKDAVKKVRFIKSTEELLAFTRGEKRLTITKLIPAAKKLLEK